MLHHWDPRAPVTTARYLASARSMRQFISDFFGIHSLAGGQQQSGRNCRESAELILLGVPRARSLLGLEGVNSFTSDCWRCVASTLVDTYRSSVVKVPQNKSGTSEQTLVILCA